MQTSSMNSADELIDERVLSKLRWRCRRGLLENDIFIERFFKTYASTLTVKQVQGLNALMDLSDSDLLDLHLGRKTLAEVDPNLLQDEVCEVLSMLKNPLERSV